MRKLNSLVISSLLTTKESPSELISLCLPTSLGKWKKRKRISDRKGTRYSEEGDRTCDVTIPELKERRRTTSWESLNKQIKKDSKVFGQFPKVCCLLLFLRKCLCFMLMLMPRVPDHLLYLSNLTKQRQSLLRNTSLLKRLMITFWLK